MSAVTSVTGLARLSGRISRLLSVHLGNFRPVDRDAIQETKPKWWNINLYRLRLLYGFVDCFRFSHYLCSGKTYQKKIMPFLPLCCDSEAILSKNVSSRSPGLNSVIWKNFHPQYRDLGRKVRDFGNRGSPASHLKKLNFFFRRKERRGDISEIEPAQSTGLT